MKCLKIDQSTMKQARKLLHQETRQMVVEDNDKYCFDSDSVILWVLHEELGLGEARLKRVWERFYAVMETLKEHYLSEDYTEDGFICRRALKSIGVDLEEWYKEKGLSTKYINSTDKKKG